MRHCQKIPFETKADAMKEIKIIKAYQGHSPKQYRVNKKSNKKLRAYECPHCNKWHMTTIKQKRKF